VKAQVATSEITREDASEPPAYALQAGGRRFESARLHAKVPVLGLRREGRGVVKGRQSPRSSHSVGGAEPNRTHGDRRTAGCWFPRRPYTRAATGAAAERARDPRVNHPAKPGLVEDAASVLARLRRAEAALSSDLITLRDAISEVEAVLVAPQDRPSRCRSRPQGYRRRPPPLHLDRLSWPASSIRDQEPSMGGQDWDLRHRARGADLPPGVR
jgi:hypothetical protein